jgi:hypothetical protein
MSEFSRPDSAQETVTLRILDPECADCEFPHLSKEMQRYGQKTLGIMCPGCPFVEREDIAQIPLAERPQNKTH